MAITKWRTPDVMAITKWSIFRARGSEANSVPATRDVRITRAP
jgi:hypothetical protein